MGLKEGVLFPFAESWEPVCGLCRRLLPYQLASSSIQPFGQNKHGPKLGGGGCALWSGGSWVPIEHKVAWAEAYLHTKCHLSPSSSVPTTDIGRKLGDCALLGEGKLGPHLIQRPLD